MTMYRERKRVITTPYLLVLPAATILCCVILYPMIDAMRLSLTSTIIGRATRFIGFGNYIRAVSDPQFWNALLVTIKFWFTSVAIQFSLGLALAVILNNAIIGQKLFSSIVYIPIVTTPVVVAIAWRWLFNPDFGLLNVILGNFMENPPIWLGQIRTALPAVITTEVWHHTGFCFLILLAALQSIPDELYDAADVDGASGGQKLFRITLPSIKPALSVVLMLRTIDTFKVFDKVFVMTGGGPARTTETLSVLAFRIGFEQYSLGYSAAFGLIAGLIIMGLCLVIYKVFRSDDV